MIKEIDIFGVYFAPFAGFLVAAFIVFVPLRSWFDRIEIQQFVWHRPLFDLAIFVIILSVIGLVFMI
jgi:Protein of unknown function (DUF1656)